MLKIGILTLNASLLILRFMVLIAKKISTQTVCCSLDFKVSVTI